MRHLRMLLPACVLTAAIACSNPPAETRAFIEGRELVTQGRYAEAEKILSSCLAEYPNAEHASRAQFFLAKCAMGRGDLAETRHRFEECIRVYPDSLEAHKSHYKLAELDLMEGRTREALRRFREVASRADGPLAPEAEAMSRWLEERAREDTTPDGGTP